MPRNLGSKHRMRAGRRGRKACTHAGARIYKTHTKDTKAGESTGGGLEEGLSATLLSSSKWAQLGWGPKAGYGRAIKGNKVGVTI